MGLTLNLFDKYVNLHFYTTPINQAGQQAVKSIITPDGGRKPTIRLSGRWISSELIQRMEIRVTNLLVDEPLSDFGTAENPGFVSIEAGYKNSLSTTIKGKINNSFQEQPGPDGITCFEMLVGNYTDWTQRTIKRNYLKGALLIDCLQDICSVLNISLQYSPNLSPSLSLPHGVNFNGLAKDLLNVLTQMFYSYDPTAMRLNGLRLAPIGSDLLAFPADTGTGTVYQLDYVSHASHVARGFDIQAPWIPTIRPMDTVRVNPSYFRQDLGGSLVSLGNLFVVFMIQFEFCTDDDTNMMTLMTVGSS